jgi:hypothetical protein
VSRRNRGGQRGGTTCVRRATVKAIEPSAITHVFIRLSSVPEHTQSISAISARSSGLRLGRTMARCTFDSREYPRGPHLPVVVRVLGNVLDGVDPDITMLASLSTLQAAGVAHRVVR